MTDYVRANGNSASYSTFKFTNGNFYEVINWVNPNCAEVKDDNGRVCLIGIDKPTLRLAGNGRFERVSENVVKIGAMKVAVDLGKEERTPWQIRIENAQLIQDNKIRETVRNSIKEALDDGEFWVANSVDERLAKAEKDRDLFKQDCIKAEAVIDQLYDLFPEVRNAEQLVSAIKRAKIFSDAFIEMQKLK